MRSLNIAATGMLAQQTNVDVISHNLSNLTTTAYKKIRPEFQDLMYENLRRVGTNSTDIGTIVPTGVQLGLGVKTAATYRNSTQGTMQLTDNPLDIAINGRGYFIVELPNGEQVYTRNGTFQINPEGLIVNTDGFQIIPGIQVPEDAIAITINQSGEVLAQIAGQQEPNNLGQFELAAFINEPGLEALGDNLYRETPASGLPILGIARDQGFGEILQGYLENSNVDPVKEITALIVAQRSYEMNSKVISSSDEMLQALTQTA
ncbi:MAG: flagellar basal-body rod protein FlgG [Alphaproteobacteria bacterium]|nr:MAG: flagellar basal-body rod protein FlgG [Alphaproteobacteria bacterium]TAE82637.1 MAG: flagellar basal-body rod protein FlgG [Alphaproteobacteria bacterium]TAF12850.1 MAG: flagellar basal-body rod protein FlgG [Alphaproteobacteria bacterium]TAF37601.1 MAG: flagellar basal-body rod protein FlgG [Alphaproteobacteria bacterium]TAF75736.1 MAG: flagellar basal-body rod protein FlgG [Alphaproteobacteria bacterium]